MIFGYVYERGLRKCNQDALLFRQTRLSCGDLCMAVVCDGMGGETKGEEASYLCVHELDVWFDQELLPIFLDTSISEMKRIRQIKTKGYLIFYKVNRMLFDQMRMTGERLGTTSTVLITFKGQYYIFHIGDSRLYGIRSIFNKSFFCKLTKDHAIDKKLTKCLGLTPDFKPDFYFGYWIYRNFLLCSDGFYRSYNSDTWKNCLNMKYMNESISIAKRLRELAMDNIRKGEFDNISALLIKNG